MKKIIVAAVLYFTIFSPVHTYAIDWTPLQLSLWNPIQLFSEEKNVIGLRLDLIYGKNKNIYGIDTGIINTLTGNANGIQVGLMNKAEHVKGIQVGLLGESKSLSGIQLNGLMSKTENLKGISISYGFPGYSLAGSMDGLQIGLINRSGTFEGEGTISFYDSTGFQIGGVNISRNLKGFQIGIVNYCESMSGVQIGLVNYIHSGPIPLLPIINASF